MSKISKVQKERGSDYGKYSANSAYVGSIIKTHIDTAREQGTEPSNEMIGSIAYMAIKMARLTKTETHNDTLLDLASYADLTHKLFTKEK